MQALAAVGLEAVAHLPAASLPYGSQRLVEIARALASEPRLLLLDEPAAGMNASERAHLVQQIRRIRDSGITVLLVEHDIELVMGISEQVYVLDYGRLIARADQRTCRRIRPSSRPTSGSSGSAWTSARPGISPRECPEPEDLLVVEDLTTSYGSIEALHGVSFAVPKGEVVAVLGANGAGKSTLLHTISGLLRPKAGSVHVPGCRHHPACAGQDRGARAVPGAGRPPALPRALRPGQPGGGQFRARATGAATCDDDIAYVYELFPILGERRKQPAGTLSGGEQQMLAIGRALVGRPQLLLLDEPSMGLAPLVVERIFEALGQAEQGRSDDADGGAERGDGALACPSGRGASDRLGGRLRAGRGAEVG